MKTEYTTQAAPEVVRKVCTKCGQEKLLADFSRRGTRPECKKCAARLQRQRRKGQKDGDIPAPKTRREVLADPYLQQFADETPECFADFVETYWPDEPLPEHAKEWVAEALTHDRLLLNVPPGHAKTSIMAVRFAIWKLACDRDTTILVITKTMKLGQKIARAVAEQMEFNLPLIRDWGRFRPDDSAKWSTSEGELMVAGRKARLEGSGGTGDLSLLIRGNTGAVLGFRADWIVADDVTDEKISRSESERENQRQWFVKDVETRLQPNGRFFCIGQRVHVDDLYGWLAEKRDDMTGQPVWAQVETPAVLDWDSKKVLWPEERDWDFLMRRRSAMGDAEFNTMFQQNPSAGGNFFKEWWFSGLGTEQYPGCLDYDRRVGQGWKLDDSKGYVPVTRVVAIDPSPTQYCGMVVADVIYLGTTGSEFWMSVVDIRRDRMGQRDMIANLWDIWATYRPSAVIFEQNSVKWLHEDPEWNRITSMFSTVVPHQTGQNKNSETMGVWSLASDVQAGRIRFPHATPEDVEVSHLLIDEMLAYPRANRTSDVLMAAWLIKFNYKHLIPPEAFMDYEAAGTTWNMRSKRIRGAWSKGLLGRG